MVTMVRKGNHTCKGTCRLPDHISRQPTLPVGRQYLIAGRLRNRGMGRVTFQIDEAPRRVPSNWSALRHPLIRFGRTFKRRSIVPRRGAPQPARCSSPTSLRKDASAACLRGLRGIRGRMTSSHSREAFEHCDRAGREREKRSCRGLSISRS